MEADTRQAREDVARLRAEVEQLEGLEREMRAGYRAFLLAALELLERDATPAARLETNPAHRTATARGLPRRPKASTRSRRRKPSPNQPPVETEPDQPPAATKVA